MPETIALNGANLIAGKEGSEGRATLAARNPVDGRTLAPFFHQASARELDAAVQAARTAFRMGASSAKRAELLERIACQIEDLGDILVERVMLETGLPEGRVRGERGRTVGQLRLFAALLQEGSWVDARIETALPDRQPIPRPDLRTMALPIGPVAVFGASNFPLAFSVAGGDTASALAAGCPVVCKAHPAHPGTSELVGRAIAAAVAHVGLHPGWFSLLHGAGPEIGQTLAAHEGIEAVGFTGSLTGGRALFDTASRRARPIPVFAEMGSVNPVVVTAGALDTRADAIARGLVGSVTLGSGQFCTNPGLVFVERADGWEAFLNTLEAATRDVDAQIMLHEGIAATYRAGIERVGGSAGVRKAAQGSAGGDGATAAAAVFVTDADTFRSNPTLHEEVFGPSTIVVECDSLEEVQSAIELLAGNLTGTVHAQEAETDRIRPVMAALRDRVGRVIMNGYPTGVEVCHAMQHGGPYPATTAPSTTSVGTTAIRRWVRPVCFQDIPEALLPVELHDSNPRGIQRLVNGTYTRNAL